MAEEPEEENATVQHRDNTGSGPLNAPVRATAIFREYHTRESPPFGGTRLTVVSAGIHNQDDEPIEINALMFSLALTAGVRDGESFEILVRRRDAAQFPFIKWIIDRVRGLHAVKLTPKKLITPETDADQN